jgi:uncharacterized protein (DUF305 family)
MKTLIPTFTVIALFSANAPADPTAVPSACCTVCKCNVMGPTHAPCGCVATCTCGSHHVPDKEISRNPQIRLMGAMMDEMDKVPWEGTSQRHFLAQMIPHHRCAVAMAKLQIASGKNPAMIQLAKSIISGQSYEIQLMETLLKQTNGNSKPMDADYRKAMTNTMDDMMSAIPVDSKLLADPDRAFAAIMLPHHQAAIDMAAVILRFHPEPAIRTLADNIIATQDVEIRQLKEFLQSSQKASQ